MKSLLLDRGVWDLVLDNKGNIAAASDPYRIAQDVASAIKLFQGELWYDTTKGVPYWGQILGEMPPIELIKARFVAAALTVPGVATAVCYIDSIEGREVKGQVIINDIAGHTSNIPIGQPAAQARPSAGGVALTGTPSVSAGGSGYQVGDVLTLIGGSGRPAEVIVLTTSAGAVATVQFIFRGAYAVLPESPMLTSGGTGTGASIAVAVGPKATGGTVTTDGAYTIHAFTEDGTFAVLQAPLTIDYLIVAGGGGAGLFGGGGAGDLLYTTGSDLSAGDYPVTIGLGGDTLPSPSNGGDTVFIDTVIGGGCGGGLDEVGNDGGSGGGGGAPSIEGGTVSGGAAALGNAGGAGTFPAQDSSANQGGGGGGAGSAGGDGSCDPDTGDSSGGSGGDGVQNSITGAAVWYAGGGGGFGQDIPGTPGLGQDGVGC
jgi:hypothetical protein